MLRLLLNILLICVFSSSGQDIDITRRRSSFTQDTFEFGINRGRVLFTKSGNIGLLEKTTKVPIILPYCMELTYVRVDVDNKLGPPYVNFDSNMNTVNIIYRILQYSRSSYVVTAKGEPASHCS